MLSLSVFAAPSENNWQSITNYAFSFSIPNTLKKTDARGIDSFAEEYRGNGLTIVFDYGIYSNSFQDWPKETTFEEADIDGDSARIGTCANFVDQTNTWFRSQVHFKTTGRYSKLSMHAWCRSTNEFVTAKTIFKSIRFIRSPKEDNQ